MGRSPSGDCCSGRGEPSLPVGHGEGVCQALLRSKKLRSGSGLAPQTAEQSVLGLLEAGALPDSVSPRSF